MRTIVLISCAFQKEDSKMEAQKIYKSTLFKKSLAYAKKLKPDAIYILSAKHHLLPLDKVIEVSTYMKENFSFVVFEVENENQRKSWEKKLISTLGQAGKKGIIKASKNWLGKHSSNPNIKASGLWQEDDMNDVSLTLAELQQLLQIIQQSNAKYKL